MRHVTRIAQQATWSGQPRHVLLVGFKADVRERFSLLIAEEDWNVQDARGPAQARTSIAAQMPAAVIWASTSDDPDVAELAHELRSDHGRADVPLIAVGHLVDADAVDQWSGLPALLGVLGEIGAGDASRWVRPASPVETVPDLRYSSLDDVHERVACEITEMRPGASDVALVIVSVEEHTRIAERMGPVGVDLLDRHVLTHSRAGSSSLEVPLLLHDGSLFLLIRRRRENWVRRRVEGLSRTISSAHLETRDDSHALTPVVGWAMVSAQEDASQTIERARAGWAEAARNLDLVPVRASSEPAVTPVPRRGKGVRFRRALLTASCILLTLLAGVVIPFALLAVFGDDLVHLPAIVHIGVTASLLVTATSIWAEGIASLFRTEPPPADGPDYIATAIIAAYLPNEAATIVGTVENMLRTSYGNLEVVLAYNTPERLPIEDELAAISAADPRLVLLRVPGSTSKAQNVNAAIGIASGLIVGIFDADHHPEPDAFSRARCWLDSGYDVVQGRCVVRNGTHGLIARTVAVEFESIYGASHPGRTRVHGFGIFGGSNGYWRASTLHAVRLQGAMLTEDIDSSIRLVLAGGRITTDPRIVSYELAPTTLTALWRQRLRWAQGWYQVTRRWSREVRDSTNISFRQKLGLTFLLRWRELNAWITQLIVPWLAYLVWRDGGLSAAFGPNLFLLATLFTVSTAPGQVFFAWRNATPGLRRRPVWFVSYLLVAALFYTEWKNLATRVAHVREVLGINEWVVTPRR